MFIVDISAVDGVYELVSSVPYASAEGVGEQQFDYDGVPFSVSSTNDTDVWHVECVVSDSGVTRQLAAGPDDQETCYGYGA